MALQLRPNCEYCDKDLPPNALDARICLWMSAIRLLSGGEQTSGERTDIEARDPTRPSSSPAAAPSRLVPGRPHPDLALFVSRQDHRHGLGMDRLPNATALEELVSCRRKISLLDITQGRPCGTISIWRHVRDDAQSQMGLVGMEGK